MQRPPAPTLVAAVVLVLSVSVVGAAMVTAEQPTDGGATAAADATPESSARGQTLVGVQAYGWFGNDNGSARVVSPEGAVVWEWAPENGRVFDVESLSNGDILASVGVAETDCPAPYDERDPCVHNRVVQLAYPDQRIVWEYDWYDAFPNHHEVHDADRLPSGETAIVDMGNDRAFTVTEAGVISWQWNASEHIGAGTPFFDQYVPENQRSAFTRAGPEADWTHMNDIDRLANGNFQLSIRNFDVLLEVDPRTDAIVDVVGRPASRQTIHQQHNPMRLGETVLVADSENDRVVELDVETDELVWEYDGTGSGQRLQWPRDVDRLPNGNTLITDSRNFRVLEIDANGTVVWEYSMRAERGIAYEADRIGAAEEDDGTARVEYRSRTSGGLFGGPIATVNSWLGFVPFLPAWLGIVELVASLLAVGASIALGSRWRARR
jgi:hypothetical protein